MNHRMASTIGLLALSATLAAASGGTAQAQGQGQPEKPSATKPVNHEGMLQDPDKPLDQRIDPAKVGAELDLPPLPEQVVLPMPPWFHLAEKPDDIPISMESWKAAHDALSKGVAFLRKQQADDGSWSSGAEAAPTGRPAETSPVAVAITALAMKAIAQSEDKRMEDPSVRNAISYIKRAQLEDGSYEGGALGNYVTSCVVMALATADEFAFATEIHRAVRWLQSSQWDQTEGVSARQSWFGGAGYGRHGRPDLSNTQFMLDALYDAHLSPDEPAVQRALVFASRTQNLKVTNDAPWASSDGGFVYTPANGGESEASESDEEGGEDVVGNHPESLRSYGSMTYAGFKSLIFAGLSQQDIRVRAAFDWIRHHWTFDENPGLGQQGLYYYYNTMARCLTIAQQHHITDADGVEHNWREEMIAALLKRQRDDGRWQNDADRWMEGDPNLCTAYSLLALEEALKPILKLQPDE